MNPESWNSLVASATEFMIATTKPMGLTPHRAAGANVSSNPATPAIVLWPAARVSSVISSETLELCQRSSLLGVGHCPAHPVLPQVIVLRVRAAIVAAVVDKVTCVALVAGQGRLDQCRDDHDDRCGEQGDGSCLLGSREHRDLLPDGFDMGFQARGVARPVTSGDPPASQLGASVGSIPKWRMAGVVGALLS